MDAWRLSLLSSFNLFGLKGGEAVAHDLNKYYIIDSTHQELIIESLDSKQGNFVFQGSN